MSSADKSSGSEWKFIAFLVAVVISHFYIRSNITGEWSYAPPGDTSGVKMILDIKSGGSGMASAGGNDLIKTLSVLTGASQPLQWWQYGPVTSLKINGKETIGVCLPFARKMYLINFSGISEFERVDGK